MEHNKINKNQIQKRKIVRKFGFIPGITSKKKTIRTKTPGEKGRFLKRKSFRSFCSETYKDLFYTKQFLKIQYLINEKELKHYILKLLKTKEPNIGINLLRTLETRVNIIVYRLGIAKTLLEAHQLISHGQIFLNNQIEKKRNTICKIGDIISLKNTRKETQEYKKDLNEDLDTFIINAVPKLSNIKNEEIFQKKNYPNKIVNNKRFNKKTKKKKFYLPSHLEINFNTFSGKVIGIPKNKEFLAQLDTSNLINWYLLN